MAVWAPIRPNTSPSSCSVSTRSPTSAPASKAFAWSTVISVNSSSISVDDAAGAEDADLAGLGVDPDVDVLVAGDAPVGGLDAVLDRPDELLAGDLLLGVELEEGTDEVSTHDGLRSLSMRSRERRSKRNVGVTHVTERPFSWTGSIHPDGWTPQTGRAWRAATPAVRVLRLAGRREPPRDVVLEDVDELGDEAVAAERPVELAVDEDRRDRVLERARQRDPDVGVLRLARAVDDAAHDRDAQVLGARDASRATPASGP